MTTEIQVLIVSLDDGTINLTSDEPGVDRIVSITSNKGLTLSLPVTLVKTGSYVGRKTVTVESSIDIAVFVAILGSSGTGDGYMAIPITSLQKKYFFSSNIGIRLSVVSFYENTEIGFTVTVGSAVSLNELGLSSNSNITMGRGQNLQVQKGGGPMGYVTGSKPFMLLQGSRADSTFQYITSITDSVFFTAANLYIIPYLYNGTDAITFCNPTGIQSAKSDGKVYSSTNYLLLKYLTKVRYIQTDFPTSCQYIGHGFSITVPSVSSYTTYCRFLTPYQQRFTHHSAVLIKTEYDSEIKFIDIGTGHEVSPDYKEVVTVEGVSYSALYYNIEPGQYEVYNGNPNATLTVISYGFGKGIQAAYGYPVCFKKI
ncbi:hypothetical protein FSP39_008502 [Pinctada imbricata]|uniref:IgGFc-binding protein N-terminal domain-containing protein n=1 Tax=Pinctada imbricata TaxID=66713 RepID=A0AA88YRV3_PINIB|nr:hypothetical protein FSP39_008502 [Pinctada imbricata]